MCLLFLGANLFAQPGQSKIHPYLQELLKSAPADETLPVYIMLEDRLSLEYLQSMTRGMNKQERRREVVRLLKQHAGATQGRVLAYLETARKQGLIDRFENIWSINVIAFHARPAAIYDLARDYAEIEQIRYDRPISREEAQDDLGISRYNEENNINLGPSFAPQQGLVLIRAPLVWAEGDSGQGVILA
ncbi:MAG: hypothetical protein L6Q94_23415, partial [Calditrichia bacterium]|nr:hypothetical protein [Calditrichia bacterium]